MKRFLLLILVIAPLYVLAQESNCGNGIDDDGDGFIDCFDSNCANSVSCKDFYVGRDKLCQVPPTGTAKFEMKLGSKSPNRTNWTSSRIVAGDLDNDGVPEVVTLHHDDKKLYILDGRDLSVKYTGTITGTAEYFDHAIGNVNGDACAEIFIAEKDGSTYYMSSYDCKGLLIWRKAIYGQPITMGLADFDEDGKVELYYRNEILDAVTGTRLVKGSGTWTAIDAGPVAVDILDPAACTNCAGLELVLGGSIYSVNLGARTADAGTLTLEKSIPAAASYFPKNTSFGYVTSLTSVADYNQDGFLDVLMSGATGSTGGTTSVFFWDVKNATYKIYKPSNNWKHGTGRLNIADIDGDGKSNTTFVSGSKLFALKDDFTLLWSTNINEGTSGYTSTTVFDFNNDNAVEIVYRDESYLYIINGKTGAVFTQATCRSRTANDYPIVVDVDGDGSTEICVTCATNDTDDINDISRAPYGQVRSYKSNLEAWVPARKVWNQHGYFNVNVNDDLTIPRIQQKHHLVFSTGSCTTGANRALNTFLNQSPFLDSKGCPTYASADVTYDAASVKIVPPTCPDQAFTVSLDIRNIGDLGVSGTLPVTFYQGNPTQAGAVKLNTVNINLSKFNVGDVVSLTNLAVQGTGSSFTLYVVLNDNGSTVPTPIKLPNSTFLECNYTNNIVSAGVTPAPFSIQTSLISNNITCAGNSTPPNGAAEVYRLVGSTKVTAGYTFYWFDGTTVGDTAVAVFKGPVRTGLAAGTYSIIAYSNGIKCGSTSAQVVVGEQTRTLTAAITENKPYTSCKNPDGKLTVVINGGDPFGNFTYQWFEGNVFGTSPILSTSHVITNVSAVTYSVLVTEKSTGCQILESAKVTDQTVKPVVSASSTDASCSPANSGSASANVSGNTSNYNFYWYVGSSVKPSPDFTGSNYTSLTAGDYTVVASNKSSGCNSDPLVVTVASKLSTPVATTITAQQTSCTTPNGAASALVSGGNSGFTFKWFRGNNTLAANLIGSTSTISGLAAGVYTVEATNATTGCVDTEIVTINDNIVIPVVTANVTSQQTQCSPLNGAVSASVSGGGSFTYYWFNGNVGTPDTLSANFKGASYTGLTAGYYTVVAANKSTRCVSARALVQVLDNTVIPSITTSTVNQTSCNVGTPNGQASANVGGTTAGYKFRWFAGSDTSTFLSQAASITNRAAGTYTVKAMNTATRCFSTRQVTITNNLVNPAVVATATVNNTNCAGVTPTGSITIQVNGGSDPVTDFTIQWYEGTGTTTALGTTVGSTTGTNNETAQGLSAGTYTVRVTDNVAPGNGCSTTTTFTITNNLAVSTIESADIALTSQSNCSPANGSATVGEITVNGVGSGSTAGYTFTWLQSNGTTVIPGSGTAATVGVALAAGSYTVKATNSTTNCVSAVASFTITDTHVNPVVTSASTINNTNCTGSTPNGSITVNIDGVAAVAGQHNIEWFEGNGTTVVLGTTVGSVTGAANETAQGLSAGTYTVRVTDLATPNTGCATTTTFTITNTPAVLTIESADIALTSQSNCSPANGSATVGEITVNGVGAGSTAGYTFTWLQSNGTTVIPGSGTAATVGVPLAAGTYTVKATNSTTNCVSAVASFTITDTHVNPVVTSASTINNTNCTGSTPNGSITVNIDGVAAVAGQHNIEWFEGNGTTTVLGTTVGSVTGAANETAQGLSAGTYTVRVTDLATPNTGCATTTTFTITNTPAVLTIESADIALTSQSNCSPANGSATVGEITVNGVGAGSTAGYTFTWLQSNGTTVIPGSGTAATVGVALAAGNYTVKATNSTTNCVSAVASFTITDTHVNPAVTSASTINNTNCTGSTPNGSITVNIDGVAAVAGQHNIEWFEGNGTTTVLGTTVGSVTGAANQTAQGLSAGTYTVRVTDLLTPNTGCATTTTFTITNTPAVLTIESADIALTSQSNCSPANGSATVGEITVNGVGAGSTAGYTFTWLQSNGTTVIPGSGTAATVGVALAAGNYTVKATNSTTNCVSAVASFTITDTHVNPVVTSASTINNTNCTGSTPNGSITVNIDGVAAVAGQHNIEWFEGNGTTVVLGTTVGSVTGAANQTAQGLSAGTYTVRVTDLLTPNTGCATTTTFTITNTPAVLTIESADITLTSQSNCSPANGSATVGEITVNGVGSGSTAGYTFTWLQSNGTTVIPGSGTAATVGVALAAGTYTVKATNSTTNCVSAVASFTITDTHVNPAVTSASTINNTNCTGSTPNGSITVNIDGVAAVAGQHNIEWFEGNGTTVVLGTTVGSVTGAANQTAQGLSAGQYTVRVTDLATPNTGCATTTTFTITNTPAVLTIESADITLTSQSNCSPANGSATVGEITVNGVGSGSTAGYTFTWLQSNGTTVIPGSGTAATVGVALAAGTYTVKATNSTTNCVSAVASFTITDTHVNPAVTSASTINNTNCTGSTPNGSITVNIDGVAAVAGQHNIEWFEGNGTTTVLGTTVGSVTGAANQTAQGLSAGTYTVRVTDLATPNTGCATTTTFTITNTPAVLTIESADIALTSQSNCSPANGSATVGEITVNGVGAGSTAGYTFTWLQSNGTTVIPGSGTAATVGVPLAAGTYTVKATNSTTNCVSAVASFTITDTHVNPAVTSASTINNTNCTGSTPNGSITVNIDGVAAVAGQHNIEWFEGNGTTTVLGTTVGSVTGAANQTAQGLSAGTYTVRVTDLLTPNTGCATTTTFTITNTPAVLTIESADITLTSQSNCSPANGSATVGEITVNGVGSGSTAGYTFTWLQSNGTTVIPGSGTAATVGVALAAGTYTVKATNSTTNCVSAVASFTITDTHVNPVVTSASTINNTNCTGSTPNGSITVNIDGVAAVAGQHNIEWFEGNGTTTVLGTTVGSVTGAANQTAQGLSAGTYTVRVTDLLTPNTGCATTTTFTITNTPAVLTIESADIALTSQSNCSPANGSATVGEITVNGLGSGSTAGYTFTWLQSNGTTVIPGSGTAATVGVALAAGNYTVKATNSTTNCVSAVASFTITDTHVNPVTTLLSSTDNTNCTGVTPNGSITIEINGGDPVSDFIIEWFEGNGTTTPLGTTVGSTAGINGETAQEITGGTYTVRVRDNASPDAGCAFTTTFTILDNLTLPAPSGTPSANTACDPAKSNGSIIADVGGTTVGYTFHIFRGQNTLPANEVTTGPAIANNLSAGVYTVQAITNATGCSATTEVTVTDNIVLPAITLTASTNVTSCSTPDGTVSVTAMSIGALADYTFSWYNGNSIKAVADYTGSTVTGLLAGNYTVTATNNVLGCDVQVPVTVTVNNDPSTLITITELLAPEKIIPAVCNDGLGQIAAQAFSPANAAGFTFSWFFGDKNTGLTAEGSGQDFGLNSNRISNAASGEIIVSGLHTVIALDNTTGCQDSLVIHLSYSDEAALLSILTTPQTDCLNPDGGFDATITPSPGTVASFPLVDQSWYELRVYQNGNLITSTPGVEPAPTVISGLAAGNYTVLAVETHPSLPGCSSAPNDVPIGDARTYPVITANALIDNANCPGSATDTGSISLTVDGTPTPGAGYSYSWFDGKLLTSPALPGANVPAPGHTATGIDGGFYTVEVTSAANNCKAQETLYINNTPHVIAIAQADLNIIDQSNCSPADGSAEVMDVLIDGASSGGTGGYSFQWFLSDGVTPIPLSSTNANVGTPIAADVYFVQATNILSNCTSPLVQLTVDDVSVTPVITMNTLVDNSNCTGAPSNGSITIDVDGGAPAATDYTIQWYTGIGTGSPIGGATAATLSNLAAGDYTVEVIDILSPGNTCSSIATFTIADDLPVFTIAAAAITVTDQTDCVGNGTATVTDVLIDGVSNGGTAGFTFEWFDGNGTSIDGPGAGAAVGVLLAAGNYSVIATNTTSLCSSIVSTFTVDDVSVTPVITMNTLVDNSNCTGAPSNGSITIDVDGGAPAVTDYTIQWYTGIGTGSPIGGATTATLSNLAAGDYTVEVIDILSPGNTCSSIATFTIADDLPVFTIAAASITVTDQTDCVGNGTATVTDVLIDGVSNGGTAGFTFEWFDGNGTSIDGPGAGAAVGVLLAAGNYSVIATNTTSLCSSIVSTFTVDDVSVTPVITMNTLVDNSNCTGAPSNGSITIDVDGGAPAVTDYTIQWYTGIGTGSPIGGATTATLSNLAAGDYTVEVIDILSPGNTCSSIATFTIADDLPVFTIAAASITVTDQTDCVANGTATVTDVLIDGVSNGGTAGFTFEWFDGNGTSIDGPGAGAAVGVLLAAGNYSVIATNTTSLCSSIVSTFTVDDVSVTPVITMNTLVDNSNCTGAPSNGSITIDVDGGAPAVTDYTIQWYTGIGTGSPIGGATTATLSNLAAGDYTVEVIDILSPGNTCSSIATFTIADDLPVFTIAAASITVTDQTDCVANGTATVTDVLIDGVSNGGTAGFTFEWFDGNGTSIDGPGAGAAVGVLLAAGNYSVIATNTTSLCSSIVSTFTVDDVSVTPVITMNTLVDNSNCTGAPSNGSITIDVDGGAPAVTDYTIQWYTGIGTGSPIGGATTATLSNLAAGDYTVEVIDILSPGNTCSSIATFTIADDLPVFTIAAASITVTDQTDCVANGTATVTDVLIDGVSNGGTAGFTFEWFDGNGTSIDGPGAGAAVGVLLAAGNYSVIATNTTSLCSSIVSTFTVDDVSVTPVITMNTLVDNSNCTGAPSNGSITIDVDGGAPAVTDYTIQWYTGIGTGSPIGGATTATISSLAAGDYTVEVIDILSPGNTCSSIATFTIMDRQNNIEIDASDLTITDNSDCLPLNGSASVTDILFNGVPAGNTTGYTFEWLQSDFTPVDPGNGPTVGINLAAGNYFVRATHVASNCASPITAFEIKDVTVQPAVVALKDQDNIACNTNYTGQVSATVSEGFTNGVTAGYLFEWFAGSNNTNPVDFINSGPILTGLQEGDYTVRVTDTTTPSGNCVNTATVTVDRKIPVLNGTLTAAPQTTCAPIQNGSMTVNNIQLFVGSAETSFDMNLAADRNQFSFQWFDVNLANVSPAVTGANISPNLSGGTFYVQISDVLGCTSDYIIGLIDDQTVKPQVRLDEFVNPAICILPEVRGTLLVSADNNTNFSDYTFQWFEGANTGGAVVEPNSPFLGNIAYTSPPEYTVQVTNNATQCISLETYKFETDTVDIQVVASAVPLTSCVTDNGSLFAATRTGSGQLYNIEWYIGAGVGTTPDFTGNEVLIAPIGTYTAIARHPSLSFCNSIPDTIDVTDERSYPTVTATQKAALTYCDPSNPNGVAFATVNGAVVGYTFDWYEGSLSGTSIYTGSEAGILKATTYIVQATDVISGCTGTTSILIENDPSTTPVPQITVLSDRTDCAVFDGALTADVNGFTKDHIFNWYNGSAVKNQPDAVGEIYGDLESGVYTVTAIDRITGCMSEGVQGEVMAVMVYPEFDIKTINNICGESVGVAKINVTGEVEVKAVEWDIQGAIEPGPQVQDLPSGTFTVTAISFKNCETSKTFEVKTDIAVYNAISKNNDGLNEIFEVGCISEYPNNSVRIFNRAGTLVYEAGGYDNQDVYFNGVSNRGVSILGNELPDGTYFYIITKGDGSEPKTGYLELLH